MFSSSQEAFCEYLLHDPDFASVLGLAIFVYGPSSHWLRSEGQESS